MADLLVDGQFVDFGCLGGGCYLPLQCQSSPFNKTGIEIRSVGLQGV